MTFPRPGLVIRYSYLWADEHARGREEGTKDRPCAVLLAVRTDADLLRVIVLPITHRPPHDPDCAIEIPAATKRRLGLDEERSFLILNEANAFAWPGPDLRPLSGRGPESVVIGTLPGSMIAEARDRFLKLYEKRRARFVTRTE